MKIDDTKPLGADDGIGAREFRVPIRPAMPKRSAHVPKHIGVTQRRAIGDHSVDSAHRE
jgi:hypothetical protein